MNNHCFIHNKSNIATFFGQVVMSQAKDKLITNMTKYQIAAKPGHRASEHLFVVKSVLALIEERKEAILFSTWDLKKFFDSESLIDVMGELYESDIKGKVYRLLFKMNENTRIAVKTPVGKTEYKETGENVGQGTVEGAIVSAVSIDRGVNDEFKEDDPDNEVDVDSDKSDKSVDHNKEIKHPVIFQDYIGKLSKTVKEAQLANKRIENMTGNKLLDIYQ